MTPAQRGFQLIELIVALAVLGSLVLLGAPSLLHGTDDLRLHMAAGEVAGVLRTSRSFALRYGANVAVKFSTDRNGTATFALYRDGNGNGVLNREIATGKDPLMMPPQSLKFLGRDVVFGFPPGPPPRDPGTGKPMDRLDDPIRFNDSDLASFGPLGTSTPGSVYLRNGSGHLMVVRVSDRTGKVSLLTYDAKKRLWRD
ncbi:MAG TPA: prepilin-type N-terminal cleavage/methylation domain-containing protein [Thermoanaerobaculia bacterium]|nr:prepilin-type N-terminal cleavage/methylation domain-containing protein [Thermoanaerobaculia bacterium]